MQEGDSVALEREWELTGSVLGAAIAVHKALGPGFIEGVYEEALVLEMTCRRIGHLRQVVVPVVYEGVEVGRHRLDLLVENQVVVELKAIRDLADEHFAIVRSYMRATGCPVGLLLNFGKPTLEARRVYPHQATSP